MSESNARAEIEIENRSRQIWPHRTAYISACFSCAVGIYNINRFSYLVYLYKGPFLIQFFVLSFILGIPFFYLMMLLGNTMGQIMDHVWNLSPTFKGFSITFLYIYSILGTYSSVPLSWLFVYFRDSFISAKDKYRWSQCPPLPSSFLCNQTTLAESLSWTVPLYLHSRILHRQQNNFVILNPPEYEPLIHLAIIWIIVFACLCCSLKSFGKVTYFFTLIPVVFLSVLLVRLLEEWGSGISSLFQDSWKTLFSDSWCWLLAAREVILTWVLCSGIVLQVCTYNKRPNSITGPFFLILSLVMYMLIVTSFMFCCMIEILKKYKVFYIHSSYEDVSNIRIFGKPSSAYPSVINFFVGDGLSSNEVSGFQPIRLSTEVIPAALSLEGPQKLTPFWAIVFYTSMILLGLGQQISIWWCVVNSILTINSKLLQKWEILITFILCGAGYCFALPMVTNIGISGLYFLDCCIGSLWWIVFIFFIMLLTILFIEGKPHSVENLLSSISEREAIRSFLSPILVFMWNILLPISYLVLCIVFLRVSQFELNFPWTNQKKQWPRWTSYLALAIQIVPLVVSLGICLIQICRFLFKNTDVSCLASPATSRHHSIQSTEVDPPPKYTPPPSYSAATSWPLRRFLRRNTLELAVINVPAIPLPGLVSYHVQSDL